MSSSSSPLQPAVNHDSRELVALILVENRHPAPEGALLAAVGVCAHNGMAFYDMAKLLITHGALDDSPHATEGNGVDDDQDLDWWTPALVGEWMGSYDYGLNSSKESMGFQIETVYTESPTALKKGLTTITRVIHQERLQQHIFHFQFQAN